MNIFGFDFCLKLRLRDDSAGFQFAQSDLSEVRSILTSGAEKDHGRVFYMSGQSDPDFIKSLAKITCHENTLKSGSSLTLLFENNDERKSFLEGYKNKFSPIGAAGGIPVRPDGRILLIFRRGVWDLPKGKFEKGETIKECAIREVKEETGIGRITIGNQLPDSYHIFKGRTKWRFKTTHWFMMPSDDEGELVPQAKEGITDVQWMKLKKLYREPPETYPLILDIIRQIRNISSE